MSNIRLYTGLGLMLALAMLGGGVLLASDYVFADNDSVVDAIEITVPVSCTMTGTGMNTHNATINNGTYNSAIGETTMKAFCNDNEGFAIYAIGYTDNEDGKNVLTNSTLGNSFDINTGTQTSGADSQWAMKLSAATSPTPTYPITIQNSFDSFHAVPDSYTLVAKHTSATDVGVDAEGSTLKTTYQSYISPTQPAGTYTGQVKYVLVHPHSAPEPITDRQFEVIFDGNGLTFPNGATKNRVVYENVCTPVDTGYVGNNYEEVMTSNILPGGGQNGAYTDNESIVRTISFPNADRVKVAVDDRLTGGSVDMRIVNGVWDGDWDNWDDSWTSEYVYEEYDGSSSNVFVMDGNTVTIVIESWSSPDPGYDYGIYARVYPVYDEETAGASYQVITETCEISAQIGTYAETTTWNDGWFLSSYEESELYPYAISNEYSIINYLNDYKEDLSGKTIHLNAINSYTITFDANGGSGAMEDVDIYQYTSTALPEGGFTYPHKDLVSWNTRADGTGESYFYTPNGSPRVYAPVGNARAGETVTLYAQWGDCRISSICYDDNGANSPTQMGRQSVYISDGLYASNFQRAGYGFAGWNTRADGTGTNYGPNQSPDFTWQDLEQSGVRLYAMWVPSAGNLQSWSGCGNLNIGDVTALTDLRDNDTYAVAKLADGNCWMIENLRLDAEATRGDANKALAQGYATSSAYGNFIGLADAESSNFAASSSVANSIYYSGTQSGTASINIGTSYYPSYRMPRYNNANTASPQSVSGYVRGRATYSMGNYYTWSAAMANTIAYSSPTDKVDGKTSETVNTSICPTGWRLPYGRDTGNGLTSGGFYYLHTALVNGETLTNAEKSNRWRSYPNNFVFAGTFSNASVDYRGSRGNYWSSTARSGGGYGGSYSWPFYIYTAEVLPGTDAMGANFFGASVRCVMIAN